MADMLRRRDNILQNPYASETYYSVGIYNDAIALASSLFGKSLHLYLRHSILMIVAIGAFLLLNMSTMVLIM